jgi:hypothetical protein
MVVVPKVRDAIELIEGDGWREEVTRGSHRQFKHPIQLHVEGLVEDKLPVPVSTSFVEYVVVPVWRPLKARHCRRRLGKPTGICGQAPSGPTAVASR